MWHPWRRLRDLSHIDLLWEDTDDEYGHATFVPPSITLAIGLTQAERRCTLTHELIHHERGQVLEQYHDREEAAVERESAKRLIGLEQLGDALAWSNDMGEIADELWVDVPTLQARLTCLHPAERAYLVRRRAQRENPA